MTRTVFLSQSRKTITIYGDEGQKVTLQSRRPNGFTDKDLEAATRYEFKQGMTEGQKHLTRRVVWFGKPFYLHKGTGPPTWWWPRFSFSRKKSHLMVGWLRGMVAIGWGDYVRTDS